MINLRSRIRKCIAEEAALQRVGKRLREVEQEIDAQQSVKNDLRSKLDKELEDFEDMQRVSVRGLFYKVLGSKEEQEEKDRHDYLAANLDYTNAVETLQLLEYERDLLSEKVKRLPHLEKEISQLKQVRKREILNGESADKEQLIIIGQSLDALSGQLGELQEASGATNDAYRSLSAVMEHVSNALKWGRWDMSQKGAGYYDHKKQSAMDRAVKQASHANRCLQVMTAELGDVGISTNGRLLDINSDSSFMTVFFDNLITDWIVQQRINNTKASVELLRTQVKEYLSQVDHMIQSCTLEVENFHLAEDQILSR